MEIDNTDKILSIVSKRIFPNCISSGFNNLNGQSLSFKYDSEGWLYAPFECNDLFEGYTGTLHGGIISMILDSAMGSCMFANGYSAVTVEMRTRFRLPVKIGVPAVVSARVVHSLPPLYSLEARIIQEEQVKAFVKGKFYDQPHLWPGIGVSND